MRTGVVAVAGLLAASPVFAQQPPIAMWQPPHTGFVSAQPSPSPLVSNLQLTAPWLSGEPTWPGLSPWVMSTPLRLSLQGGISSIGGGFANCASREEPSGNTINGFAVQRFASIRFTPALTLQGFSSAGCPVDGAVGGGLTYTVALQKSLWLTASAGAYGVPPHPPFPARQSSDVRVDLTKQLDDGRSTLSVGVGRRGISVGGAW